MTETNTVWYGKKQQGSYLCKQNWNRWDLRIWGEKSWYSMLVRLWIFSITLTLQKRSKIFKCSDCAIEKYHGERQRRRSRGPALVWQAAPRRECQPTPEATQLQQDIQDLSTHFSAIIHEKLALGSTWRSHQSCMKFTRIPWTSFACEEQILFLFYGLISIKPCCWLPCARFLKICMEWTL